jgi:hypothetical protein
VSPLYKSPICISISPIADGNQEDQRLVGTIYLAVVYYLVHLAWWSSFLVSAPSFFGVRAYQSRDDGIHSQDVHFGSSAVPYSRIYAF